MLIAQVPGEWEVVVPVTPGESGSGCEIIEGVPTIKCLEAVFANVVSVVVFLTGIALLVMLSLGAFRYMTSGGDPKTAEGAQKTMTSAVMGIALIFGAYLILRLVSNFLGIPELLKFEIPYF